MVRLADAMIDRHELATDVCHALLRQARNHFTESHLATASAKGYFRAAFELRLLQLNFATVLICLGYGEEDDDAEHQKYMRGAGIAAAQTALRLESSALVARGCLEAERRAKNCLLAMEILAAWSSLMRCGL